VLGALPPAPGAPGWAGPHPARSQGRVEAGTRYAPAAPPPTRPASVLARPPGSAAAARPARPPRPAPAPTPLHPRSRPPCARARPPRRHHARPPPALGIRQVVAAHGLSGKGGASPWAYARPVPTAWRRYRTLPIQRRWERAAAQPGGARAARTGRAARRRTAPGGPATLRSLGARRRRRRRAARPAAAAAAPAPARPARDPGPQRTSPSALAPPAGAPGLAHPPAQTGRPVSTPMRSQHAQPCLPMPAQPCARRLALMRHAHPPPQPPCAGAGGAL